MPILFIPGCTDTTPVDIETVQTAASLSAKYLVKTVDNNGMFKYRINMNPNVPVARRYNILRHAGTLYAMSTFYQFRPDSEMKAAIEHAGSYLQSKFIHDVPGESDLLAVWSMPEINQSDSPLQAKLGGTGLGLVALTSIEKIHPGFTPLSDLQALGRFIVFLQKEDGSFYSKFIPSAGGRSDKWVSLYYPGEAALGLIMLYELDPSDVWMNSAVKTLEFLALSRKNSTNIPADHWALLATEKILSINSKLPVSRELLINHAIQICNTILEEQVMDSDQPEYNGGFSRDGRTTPTSTRLEGLQAVLGFLPDEHKSKNRIKTAVIRGLNFLVQAQVTDGKYSGAFPRAIGKINPVLPGAINFNYRSTEVRIDYVQHALSAMIQYIQLKNAKKI